MYKHSRKELWLTRKFCISLENKKLSISLTVGDILWYKENNAFIILKDRRIQNKGGIQKYFKPDWKITNVFEYSPNYIDEPRND